MFGKGKGNRFDPDLQTFPDILVDKIAADLSLDKRGTQDAKAGIPTGSSATLSSAELDAVDAIRSLRRQALSQFEDEQRAFAARIQEAGAARERVEGLVGEARNGIRNLTLDEENRLENARARVGGLEKKLHAFQTRHRLEGPPATPQNGILAFGLILAVGLCEVVLNGYFFAEANALGYVGGIAIAAVIAVVNVAFSFMAGAQTRFVNRRMILWRLWGVGVFFAFLGFATVLNLSVAHFRSALETLTWDAALIAAIESLRAGPLDLRSFAAWLVVGFGLLVSITAFWKGLTLWDPMPGYNKIHDAWEDAIDDYAEAYGDAQEALEDTFVQAREKLEQEGNARRVELKAAMDAVHARGTLARALATFLESCDQATQRLLQIYRDANLRARKDDGPSYFNESFSFPAYDAPPPPEGERAMAEKELAKIEEVLRRGVEALLKARESALDAYPTVREIKAGDTAPRPRVVADKTAA